MSDARRAALTFVAALALVSLLAACGGGDTDPPPAGSTAADGGPAPVPSGGASPRAQGRTTGDGSAATARNGSGRAGAAGMTRAPGAVARERGNSERKRYGQPSKRSAPFVPTARRSALKHVPEYGDEATSDEREAAQSALAAYLDALEAKDWRGACGHLLPYFVATLGTTAAPSGGCPQAIAPLIEEAIGAGNAWPLDAAPVVASLRVKPYPPERDRELGLEIESSGFALLQGPEGNDYYVVLSREGRRWLLTSLLPLPLS